MAISRTREYVADAGSVELTHNPDAMISALQKVAGHTHLEAPQSMRADVPGRRRRGDHGPVSTPTRRSRSASRR